jgi:hypothetical protein
VRPPITVDAGPIADGPPPEPEGIPEPVLPTPAEALAPVSRPAGPGRPVDAPQPWRNGGPVHPPIPRSEGARPVDHGDGSGVERGATAPQLRRFIKSRAYVPIHELRRRFVINGEDDDVTAVDLERTRVFVGLPEREGRLIGELLRAGDIGYELSMDPITPIVVGVYPMRPVTRN